MHDTISTLTPSLPALGAYIEEHVKKGWRLQEGSPTQYSWQYEVVMIKDIATDIEIPKKAVGRPPKAA
jgi:hypothetical protein